MKLEAITLKMELTRVARDLEDKLIKISDLEAILNESLSAEIQASTEAKQLNIKWVAPYILWVLSFVSILC